MQAVKFSFQIIFEKIANLAHSVFANKKQHSHHQNLKMTLEQ